MESHIDGGSLFLKLSKCNSRHMTLTHLKLFWLTIVSGGQGGGVGFGGGVNEFLTTEQ